MFGYMDESGAPGVAKSNSDFLVVSLVVFETHEAAEKCSNTINKLRIDLGLPENYEFHLSRNSTRPQEAFISLLYKLDFRIITVAIRKNDFKHTASYGRIAGYLAREIIACFPDLKLVLDANPILHKELKKQFKDANYNLSIKMVRSHSDNLVQLADYVVALSARKLKGSEKAIKQYLPLSKKQIHFGEYS